MASVAGRVFGVVARWGGRLAFVPVEAVEEIVEAPATSELPGSPVRLALVGGHVVPTWELGVGGDALLCKLGADRLLLSGVEVLGAGAFEPGAEGGVLFGGESVERLAVERVVSELPGQAVRA